MMNINNQISCPVSSESVDENATRVAASLVFVLTSTSLLFQAYWLCALLSLDFAIRSFGNRKYSLIRYFAVNITILLNLPSKIIDVAPKKFAAGIGFVFTFLIAVSQFLEWNYTAVTIGSILLLCAFLEFAFAYCVGCVVYTFLLRYGIIRNSN